MNVVTKLGPHYNSTRSCETTKSTWRRPAITILPLSVPTVFQADFLNVCHRHQPNTYLMWYVQQVSEVALQAVRAGSERFDQTWLAKSPT